MPNPNDSVSYQDAFSLLSQKISQKSSIKIGSFEEFLVNIWAKSFDKPQWYKLWHVGYIAEIAERAYREQKNIVCMAARFHLKTSILGQALPLYIFLDTFKQSKIMTSAYITYTEPLAQKKIGEVKKIIRNNEQLKEWFTDKETGAEYLFRYSLEGRDCEIMPGGIFSAQRGLHINRALVADDVLKDPQNPMNLSQLEKVETRFFGEIWNIPNVPEAIRIVLGTPMAPDDLLTKLITDERFSSIVLPALDPLPGKRILCPEIISEKELLLYQKNNPKEFAAEMMMMPYSTANAYYNEDLLKKCENPNLPSLDPFRKHDFGDDLIIAGCDVGIKVDPTHVGVFRIKNGKMIQIYQEILKDMEASDQKEHLNMVAENFGVTRGYWDNTRGELDDRGLLPCWRPVIFSLRGKHTMAQTLEGLINNQQIDFIYDYTQHYHIMSLDGKLQAPRTVKGHGEAAYSAMLAAKAFAELESGGTQVWGNAQDLATELETPQSDNSPLSWGQNKKDVDINVCPNCKESAGWIQETGKCLICKTEKTYGTGEEKRMISI